MALDADPYRMLGLSRGASLDEVKRAYRRLAKANHPDAAGPGALPRFLAIQAAYDELTGTPGTLPGASGAPTVRRRSPSADPERTDATRRAYGGRAREPRTGRGGAGERGDGATSPGGPRGSGGDAAAAGKAAGKAAGAPAGGPDRADPRGGSATPGGPASARGDRATAGESRTTDPAGGPAHETTTTGPARGKATLGSTSYDGADTGPFEPDWGGASWYGTTSGTYWTINPKEYADPRKHGPEYQARARRAAEARARTSGRGGGAGAGKAGATTHTTSTWWESTSGPGAGADASEADRGARATGARGSGSRSREPLDPARPAGDPERRFRDGPGWVATEPTDLDELAPDPARAALDLARALTDPRSGGLRGRAVRAILGWLPIALGLGWLVGELSGCGRFAATCDPAVAPLTAAGQITVLAALLLLPEIAAIAAGAALVLLAAATAATLILSATGSAADEGSRRAALGALLLVAWLTGLAIAIVRRVRSGPRPARPVS